jgi:hypothetical protein
MGNLISNLFCKPNDEVPTTKSIEEERPNNETKPVEEEQVEDDNEPIVDKVQEDGILNSLAPTKQGGYNKYSHSQIEGLASIFLKHVENNENSLTSLDITEFKENLKGGGEDDDKRSLPLSMSLRNDENDNIFKFNNRYQEHDLYRKIKQLELQCMVGGELTTDITDKEVSDFVSATDQEALNHIKNVILRELETLKNSGNMQKQIGGNCGCNEPTSGNNLSGGFSNKDSSSSSSSSSDLKEQGKKSKKSKPTNKKYNLKSESSSSNFFIHNSTSNSPAFSPIIRGGKSSDDDDDDDDNDDDDDKDNDDKDNDDSESSEKSKENNSDSPKFKRNTKKKSKGKKQNKKYVDSSDDSDKSDESIDDTDEGLSIFPFNSSDVKSIVSIKNYRMLRRKI